MDQTYELDKCISECARWEAEAKALRKRVLMLEDENARLRTNMACVVGHKQITEIKAVSDASELQSSAQLEFLDSLSVTSEMLSNQLMKQDFKIESLETDISKALEAVLAFGKNLEDESRVVHEVFKTMSTSCCALVGKYKGDIINLKRELESEAKSLNRYQMEQKRSEEKLEKLQHVNGLILSSLEMDLEVARKQQKQSTKQVEHVLKGDERYITSVEKELRDAKEMVSQLSIELEHQRDVYKAERKRLDGMKLEINSLRLEGEVTDEKILAQEKKIQQLEYKLFLAKSDAFGAYSILETSLKSCELSFHNKLKNQIETMTRVVAEKDKALEGITTMLRGITKEINIARGEQSILKCDLQRMLDEDRTEVINGMRLEISKSDTHLGEVHHMLEALARDVSNQDRVLDDLMCSVAASKGVLISMRQETKQKNVI